MNRTLKELMNRYSKKEEVMKPTFYFNGHAAYKNFYLKSSEISFSDFKKIVDGILWERANPKKPEWLITIQKFIADNFDENISVFFTPNWTGDRTELVKVFSNAKIWYCSDYHYIEVLGLNNDQKELALDYMWNECEDGSWTSYLKDGKVGEIK